ncbi:MAG: hypothetical protein WDW38_005791 [Sanguina aurantia]
MLQVTGLLLSLLPSH